MANTFKNSASQGVGTALTTIYTVPASTTSTLIGLSLANIIGSNITIDVTLTDTSAAVTSHLVKSAPVPVGSSLVVVGGDQKIVMETGDILKVVSSAVVSCDVILSLLETT